MKTNSRQFLAGLLALCLGGCATTSIQETWKSPAYTSGPVQKLAVLAVDERDLVRQVMESHFVLHLQQQSQGAFVTYDLLTLPAIKADRETAAASVREKGADAILIIRLVDQTTRANEIRATPGYFAPTFDGYGDWFDYYTVAFTDMGTVWGSSSRTVYLETTLFDLKSKQRLWSALTETFLKENVDRVEEVGPLADKILAAMRKDGVIH